MVVLRHCYYLWYSLYVSMSVTLDLCFYCVFTPSVTVFISIISVLLDEYIYV